MKFGRKYCANRLLDPAGHIQIMTDSKRWIPNVLLLFLHGLRKVNRKKLHESIRNVQQEWEITKKAPIMEMDEEINKQWKIQIPVGVLDDRWNYYSSNERNQSSCPVIQLMKICSYLANVVLNVCLWWLNKDSEVHKDKFTWL